MISQTSTYLNHAGTSWPKPEPVLHAVAAAIQTPPEDWPNLFARSQRTVSEFFHGDPSRLLLTPSCTTALSLAVMDHQWQAGDRVLTSHFEHHALHRQLTKLQERGVEVKTLPWCADELIDLEVLEAELKSADVRLLAMTAACNVTGRLLPVEEAIQLAHQFGTLVLIDGAQVAGWWDLNVAALGADLFTFAGHKGPQAPWGIGGLYLAPHVSMNCPAATCDLAPNSTEKSCAPIPGYCDAGSVNLSALAGLAAGCAWLSEPSQRNRLDEARRLTEDLTNGIRRLPGVSVIDDVDIQKKMPTVAVTMPDTSSGELAERLRQQAVVVSGGLQCAPQAHMALGTNRTGVIRFSFGPRSQQADVAQALEAARAVMK